MYDNDIHQIVEECDPLKGIASTWMHIPQGNAPLWTQLTNEEWYKKETMQVNEPIPVRPILTHEQDRTTNPVPQDPGAGKCQMGPLKDNDIIINQANNRQTRETVTKD